MVAGKFLLFSLLEMIDIYKYNIISTFFLFSKEKKKKKKKVWIIVVVINFGG